MSKKIIHTIVMLAMVLAILTPAYAATNPEYPVLNQTFENNADLAKWYPWGTETGSQSIVGGELKLTSTAPWSDFASYYGQQMCKDFTAEFEFRTPEGAENDAASFIYRTDNGTNGYQIFFVRCPDANPRYFIKLAERPYNELKSGFFFPDWSEPNLDYATDSVKVKVVVSGGLHQFYMARSGEEFSATPIMTYDETTEGDSQVKYDRGGYMGFIQWHDSVERTVSTYYDDVTITCNDEAEAVIPTETVDSSAVTAGVITQDFSAALSDKWGFYRADANAGSIGLTDELLHIITKGSNVSGESAAYYKENFLNGTIEADVVLSLGNSASIVFRGQDYLRNGYQLIFDKYAGLSLCKRPYEVLTTAPVTFSVEYDKTYHAKITVDGQDISAVVTWLDDEDAEQSITLSYTDAANSFPNPGYVGFVNYTGLMGLTDAFYDNLSITKVVPAEPTATIAPTATTAPTATPTSTENPQTGDSSSTPVLFGAFLAVASLLIFKVYSRKIKA